MAKQAFELVLPKGRKVLMLQHKASDLEKIYANADLTGEEVPSHANTKLAKAGLRLTIVEVEGRPVNYTELRDRWDDYFSLGETLLLANTWAKLYFGEQGNVVPVPVTMT